MSPWPSVLVASLLGSLHCVGMCGGLVSMYAAGGGDAASARWAPHAAYHLARLSAYALLGAVAGGLGSLLDLAGASAGLGSLGVLVTALVLASWGLPRLLARRSASRPLQLGKRAARPGVLVRQAQRALTTLGARIRRWPPLWRAGALGLSSALLPCGWLYAFVVLAAGTGSAASGAGLLLAFWLGTVPALLGLGVGLSRLSGSLRARLPRLSVALVLGVCLFNVFTRWPVQSAAATLTTGAAAHTELSWNTLRRSARRGSRARRPAASRPAPA
jgi:sulfite exporter TauE/SafE